MFFVVFKIKLHFANKKFCRIKKFCTFVSETNQKNNRCNGSKIKNIMKNSINNIVNVLIEKGSKASNARTNIKKLPKNERDYALKNFSKIIDKLRKIEEKEAEKEKKEFIKERAKSFNFSVKEYLLLQEKAVKILEQFHTGHSMGCYRQLKIKGYKGYFATDHTLEEYANSCKYSPTYGNLVIELTKKELRDMELIGYVPTIIKSNDKIKKAIWLEGSGAKNHYKVSFVEGFVTSDYHATTVAQAQNWRQERAANLLHLRNAERFTESQKKKYVGIDDVLKVNCETGTNAFIHRHNLNPDFGYQIGYLISLEDTSYTRRLLGLK